VDAFWTTLTGPGGPAKARVLFDQARGSNSTTALFPEPEMNAYGYELLQEGRNDDAIVVFTMNVDAHPQSPNTYDSLADAYLAAGKRDDALRFAEKTLAMLEKDTATPADFKAQIKESAERKIAELKRW
jgi:predicted Zn-dependent protease